MTSPWYIGLYYAVAFLLSDCYGFNETFEITMDGDPEFSWYLPLPSATVFVGSTVTELHIHPMISELHVMEEEFPVYFLMRLWRARPVSGTVSGKLLTYEDNEEMTQEIQCLTHNFNYNSSWGFSISWINITYMARGGPFDDGGTNLTGSNSYDLIYSVDLSTNESYTLVKYHHMGRVYDSVMRMRVGSSMIGSCECPVFRMANSFDSTVLNSFNQGNVNKTGWWLLRVDEFQDEWTGFPDELQVIFDSNTVEDGDTVEALTGETIGCSEIISSTLLENVALTCNGTDIPSKSFVITNDHHRRLCVCSADHIHRCYRETITFTINIVSYGPTMINWVVNHVEPLGSCRDVEVYCLVDIIDVFPQPNVTLELHSGSINPSQVTVLALKYRYEFILATGLDPGENNLTCFAQNTKISVNASISFTAFYNDPPDNAPSVVLGNGWPITNNTNHNVLLGDMLNVTCDSMGATPPELNYTLSCSNGWTRSSAVLETTSTFSVGMTLGFQTATCQCSGHHISECYDKFTVFHIQVNYGPTDVTPVDIEDMFSYPVCSTDQPNITVACDIDATDVVPIPSVKLLGLPGGDLTDFAYGYEASTNVHRFNFTFEPTTTGSLTLTCVANNTIYPQVGASKDFQIFGNEPSANPPVFTLVNGNTILNNTIHDIRLGDRLEVECTIAGGVPAYHNYTFKCGNTNTVNTVDSAKATLNFTVNTDDHQASECQCTAVHSSGCYHQTSRFILRVAYGPNDVIKRPLQLDEVSVCSGSNTSVTVYCDVNIDDFHPNISTVLRGLPDGDMSPTSVEVVSGINVSRSYFTFQTHTIGLINLTCVSNNTVFPDLDDQHSFSILVKEPPPAAPVVRVMNGATLTNGTAHNARLGPLDLVCSVSGGTPSFSNITLKCDSHSTTSVDVAESHLQVTVQADPDTMTCKCTVVHSSGCYDEEFHFTVVSVHGPTDVIKGPLQLDEVSVCSGSNTTVTVYCDVNIDDFHPNISTVLRGFPDGDMSPTSVEVVSDINMSRSYFTFQTHTIGLINLICVSNNTVFPDLGDQHSFSILVKEPPPAAPVVRVINGATLTNDTAHNARLGPLGLVCSVSGGTPSFSNITLKCNSLSNTVVDAVESHLQVTVQADPDTMTCECTVVHSSGCYDEEFHFTVVSVHGPTSIVPGPATIAPFSLCQGENTNMTMHCDVDKDDVNPTPNVVLQGMYDEDIEPFDTAMAFNNIRYHFSFRPTTGGIIPVKCLGVNPTFIDITKDAEVSLTVLEQPPDPPRLTVNGEMITGAQFSVSRGNNMTVVCRVDGGYPSVSKVIIDCGGQTQETTGIEASLTVDVVRAIHQQSCSCRALHESGCNPKITQSTIQVDEPAVVIRFTGNSLPEQIEIEAEDRVEFLCEAEGIPSPSLNIVGQLSGRTLVGQTGQTNDNHYSTKLESSRAMSCNESDVYVCEASNGVQAQHQLTVLITCPPILFEESESDSNDTSDRFSFVFKPDGLSEATFKIVSRPPPEVITLYRISQGTVEQPEARRRRAADNAVVMDKSEYTVNYKEIDVQHGEVTVHIFEENPDNINDYRLDVDNTKGEKLQIHFDTKRLTPEEIAEEYKVLTDVRYTNVLVIVSIVAFILMFIIVSICVYYVRWTRTDFKMFVHRVRVIRARHMREIQANTEDRYSRDRGPYPVQIEGPTVTVTRL